MVSVALLSAAAVADPVMPDGFRMTFSDETGKTWRQTGVFPVSPSNALETLRETFRKQGYSERYDIPGGSDERHLLLWTRKDEDVILMVWKRRDGRTGCSWGISAPPSASSRSDAAGAFTPKTETNPNGETNKGTTENENERTSVPEPTLQTAEPASPPADTNSLHAASAARGAAAGVSADVR